MDDAVITIAHDIDAEWDADAQQWVHTCRVCGEQTRGWAPELPCQGRVLGGA